MFEVSDETSAPRYFVFQTFGRSVGKFFVLRVLHPFENVTKEVPDSSSIFILRKMIDR